MAGKPPGPGFRFGALGRGPMCAFSATFDGVIAAKRVGAEPIILLGRHPDRITLAKQFGATDIVSVRGDEAAERVRELTEDFGAHSVLECVRVRRGDAIVVVERINQAKSAKSIVQGLLIEALAVKRPAELAQAWRRASNRGRQWLRKLESGRVRLPRETVGFRRVLPPHAPREVAARRAARG